jgi:transposase
MASPTTEVSMVEAEVVQQVRLLHERGWGSKRIALELGIARNTVRRYLRGGDAALVQARPAARVLSEPQRQRARVLFEAAQGNSRVVRRQLAQEGVVVGERTLQRVLAPERSRRVAEAVASVRFETAPADQLQIDFGVLRVQLAGAWVLVHFLVAVLGFSRRLFAKAFLAERGEQWREGVAEAFERFGGVTRTVLCDNARALVLHHERESRTVTFHPAFLAFCRDWGTQPRACGPYRARTKGKSEAAVKYVKRNFFAGRTFASFAELEKQLAQWLDESDQRAHGTTHRRPLELFLEKEKEALLPLPSARVQAPLRRLQRRVANDAMVDLDTVRYSVPMRFVRARVEVEPHPTQVRIFFDGECIATHARSKEPYARVVDSSHLAPVFRTEPAANDEALGASSLAAMGRTLAQYEAFVQEAAR